MRLVVPDASAMVEYLLQSPAGRKIEGWITGPDLDLHIPALCDVEVCAALRRCLLQGELDEKRALEALDDYGDLPLWRHGHVGLMKAILRLRDNFSAYDAAYLALANQLDAVVVTCDPRLAKAAGRFLPERKMVTAEGSGGL